MKTTHLLALSALLLSGGSVFAQSNAAPTPAAAAAGPKVGELLQRGFEVKAMSYISGAVVLVLQNGTAAFVCETDPNGVSRVCLPIR